MEKARELGVHVVAVDVIDEFESVESKTKASAAFLISKKNFAPWAKNVNSPYFYPYEYPNFKFTSYLSHDTPLAPDI